MSFFNHWLEPTFLFWFENEGAKLFLIWVIFWISIWKLSWVFRGKIDVSLENSFWLPKPARSAQTVENSHSFQFFLHLIQIFGLPQNLFKYSTGGILCFWISFRILQYFYKDSVWSKNMPNIEGILILFHPHSYIIN